MTSCRMKRSIRGHAYLIFWRGNSFRCLCPIGREPYADKRWTNKYENANVGKWMKLKQWWGTAGGGFLYFATSLTWRQKYTWNRVQGVLRNLFFRVEVIFSENYWNSILKSDENSSEQSNPKRNFCQTSKFLKVICKSRFFNKFR